MLSPDDLGMVEQVRGYLERTRGQLKPWSSFANAKRASRPANVSTMMKRAGHNLHEFQANYVFVGVLLIVYCILTSPLLLVALGFLAVTAKLIKSGGTERKILGRVVSKDDQLKLSAAITIPLLWFSAAGGTVFWVVGASLCIVGGHAVLMPTPEESDPLAGLV